MNFEIKVLVVGDYLSPIHEDAVCKAFINNKITVQSFRLSSYFKNDNYIRKKINNFQQKYVIGPSIFKINRDLISEVKKSEYNFVFFYRPRIFKSETLKTIAKSTIIYFYNNDDPFGHLYNKYYWKNFFDGLKYCNHIFYYRLKNKSDYEKIGYKNTSLLRSYYVNYLNFPTNKKYLYDVVFVGHYENDGRDEYIKFLIDNKVNIKIFGPEWNRSKYYKFFYKYLGNITNLNIYNYNEALNQAKIALVFLSTLNSDSYTRRCFEIPATKTFMLSKYSDDLANLFVPEKEADYFYNKHDLLSKINFYLNNSEKREEIVKNAFLKLLHGNHEVTDRIKIILDQYNADIISKNN